MKTVVSACMAVCLAGLVGGCIMAPYGTYPDYQAPPAPAVYPATTTYPVGPNMPPASVVPVPVYYYYAEPPPVYVEPWFPGIWIGGPGRGWYGGGHGRGWR